MKRAVQAASPVRRPPRLGSEIPSDIHGEVHGEIRINGEVHAPSSCSRLIRSEELLGDDGDLLIDHNGEFYLLSTLPGGRLTLTGWDGGALPFTSHRLPLR